MLILSCRSEPANAGWVLHLFFFGFIAGVLYAPFKKPYNGVMDHLNTRSSRPNLSKAIEVALRELERLKREGLIKRYDQEPFEEEGIYHLTAYTKYPEKVDKELGLLSASISIEFDLPFYILVSRENGEE
jgi:hypothetical protein